MEQSAFELELLRQLVTSAGKNEIDLPQWRSIECLFYDKFSFFNGITREEYTKYVLSMIAEGLLAYDKHGYKENCRDNWTIKVTRAGFSKLGLVEQG